MPPFPEPPSQDPTYLGEVEQITADKRGQVIPRSSLRRLVIALDNALNAQQFRCRGDFIFFDSNTTGTATIQLNNTSEDPWPALALAGVQGIPIEDVFITSAAQPGKVLNLWYGYRARFLNPVQAIATIGSITNPIDLSVNARWSDDIVRAGQAFIADAAVAPSAGNLNQSQLFNPAASPIVIYVDKVRFVDFTAADSFLLVQQNTQLAGGGAVTNGLNKNVGGAASQGQIKSQNVAAFTGTVMDERRANTAGTEVQWELKPAVRLPAGQGLHVASQVVNVNTFASFEWRELAT